MSSRIIIDNWSLQNVSELLLSGVSTDSASVICVSDDNHTYEDMPEIVIQTEALFELLTQIVLVDEILIDSKFAYTWESPDTPLLDLYRAKTLRGVRFTDQEDRFWELRNYIVDKLCVTSSLRHAHAENVSSYEASGAAANPYLSGLLWGGAGMLARSSYFRTPYCPQPQRRRLLIEAKILAGKPQAFDQLQSVIRSKRLDIAKGPTGDDSLFAMHAVLPPIPVQVINESSSSSRFIETALALRDEYQPLRDWLRDAETAVGEGDSRSMKKVLSTLNQIGTAGFADFFAGDSGASISIDFSSVGFTLPLNPAAALNSFGVRAMMNRLVLAESGQMALSRYCSLLGVAGTPIEHQLFEHFSDQQQLTL